MPARDAPGLACARIECADGGRLLASGTENRFRRRRGGKLTLRIGSSDLHKTGIKRFDFADPYYLALSLSWPQFLLVLALFYLVVNGLFALLYVAVPGSIEHAAPGSLRDAFFFSIETLATVGYGRMVPVTGYGHVVSSCEIFGGLLFTAVLTGLIFVRFSRPKSRLVYADHPVVTRHEGRPVLMVRVGNGRPSVLAGARATMTLLVRQTSLEGQDYRTMVDLPLVRSFFPIFPYTITLMHVLDETSPWAGVTPESLAGQEARLFVSVSASDPTTAVVLSDVKGYSCEEIVFGRRYVDAVTTDANGNAMGDMRLVSALEAE